jgi:hypothetical protein
VGGWRLLSRWFAFAFHEAVQTPYESTGLRQLTQQWRVGSTSWQLCDVMSAGDRSMVSRWRTANNEQSVVIKFVALGGSAARVAELENYFRRERKMLRKFADEEPFVHSARCLASFLTSTFRSTMAALRCRVSTFAARRASSSPRLWSSTFGAVRWWR